MTRAAFFHRDSDDWLVGNSGARGPWSPDTCHAGPVAGAIARAVELSLTERQLVRLSIDLVRPVPMDGFRIEVDIERESRSLATTRARLLDRQQRVCATATTMHLTIADLGDVPTGVVPAPSFEATQPGSFPVIGGGHDLPAFPHSVDVAWPTGMPFAPGPNTVWMRTPDLLQGEPMSPYQRLCPLADCGNALSRNVPGREINFINTDLSINIHRLPASDWIGAQFSSRWESSGIGLSSGLLFDTQGAIGVAHQTLLLRRQD